MTEPAGSAPLQMERYYPIFVNLIDRPVIVVGGGAVACEKAAGLRKAGASITLVSPELAPALRALVEAGDLRHIPRAWRPADLDSEWALVMVATDDGAVNRAVAAAARARRFWVNAADDPAAMAAGIATLRAVAGTGVYDRLERTAASLTDGLREAAAAAGAPLTLNRADSLLTPFFAARPVADHRAAMSADTARFGRFFQLMLNDGVYLPPSQFEAWFVSTAHGEREVSATVAAARRAFDRLAAP